jgi:uncharacterized membrane protein
MRTLFMLSVLLLIALMTVSPAIAARTGHSGGHFVGGHFGHFGHSRGFIGGFYGYPYWYGAYPYPYPYYPYPYPYAYNHAYPPPYAYGRPYPQPPGY